VGAALSVLIDATIVRAFLVPALMGLLGPANWWAPRFLQRVHRRIGLHEGDAPVAVPAEAPARPIARTVSPTR
jgi:RND superfamily putative drug exporter